MDSGDQICTCTPSVLPTKLSPQVCMLSLLCPFFSMQSCPEPMQAEALHYQNGGTPQRRLLNQGLISPVSLKGLTRPGLVLKIQTALPTPTANQKAFLLVACQVQTLGNLEPCSAEMHVSSHGIAIDSEGWHVSVFCGQPGDCFPKGGSRCFAYVSTVSWFL